MKQMLVGKSGGKQSKEAMKQKIINSNLNNGLHTEDRDRYPGGGEVQKLKGYSFGCSIVFP